MIAKIPKRIIQTGKSIDLPLLSKASAINIKLLNPDFEYLFFDEQKVENFIDEKFPKFRGIFDAFHQPIQRYDFFRYLAIYHYGGFYFDLDVFLASNLSNLLKCSCVFPFEDLTLNMFLRRECGMDWEIGNYAFGATPGHPFIEAIIRNCIRAQEDPAWVKPMMRSIPRLLRDEYFVLYTTGPGLISRTLAEYPNASKEIKILFPENVCDPSYRHRFGDYGVHLMQASWRKRMGPIQRRMLLSWWWWIGKKARRESLRRGKTRSLDFKVK